LAALRRQGYGLFAARIWLKSQWAAFHAAKQAEKPEPAVPKKAKPKKTAVKAPPAKTAKAPVKKVAKKSAPVTPQPTAAAEAAPTPGVLV
jgi:hypothetical protein